MVWNTSILFFTLIIVYFCSSFQGKLKARKLMMCFGLKTVFWLKSLILQRKLCITLSGDSSKRLLTFLRGYFCKIKAPNLIAGRAYSLQVLLSLRFIPKLSQDLESPGTCAYSKVKETTVTGNCSEAPVIQSFQFFRARAGLVVPLGCRVTCSVWPFTAGYLNYCAGNMTSHWYCLRNACSSRARTEHFSSMYFWGFGVGFFMKITAYFLFEWSLLFALCKNQCLSHLSYLR